MKRETNRGPDSALGSVIRGRVVSSDMPRWMLTKMAIYADDLASPGVSPVALLRSALKYRKATTAPGVVLPVRVR